MNHSYLLNRGVGDYKKVHFFISPGEELLRWQLVGYMDVLQVYIEYWLRFGMLVESQRSSLASVLKQLCTEHLFT